MRTKTLILTALVGAASVAGALAQGTNVYSVNVVGYVTKTMQPGFNLIANPLVQTNTTLASLIPNPPQYTVAYVLVGGTYFINTFDPDLGGWDPNPNQTLDLGGGVHIFNPLSQSFDITFVGEVAQGGLTNNIPMGFSMQSSKVPQQASLTALGFQPVQYDVVYQAYNTGTTSGYYIWTYDPDLGGWDPAPDPVQGPTLAVGEAVLYNAIGNNAKIARQFTVQ
jgi:hypothetical protein